MSIFRQQKAIERLEDGLHQLRTQASDLERANRSLHLEWEELYDKVRRQMSRMSKRAAIDAKEGGNGMEAGAPEPDDGIDPISRSILLRRKRGA